MAVLFITHKFPPSIGGMQKQSYELVNGVSKHQKVYLLNQPINESKLWFFLKLRSRIKRMLLQNPNIDIIHCNDAVMAAIVSLIKLKTDIKLSCTFHGLDVVFPNSYYQKFVLSRLRRFHKIFCVSEATKIESLKRGFTKEQLVTVANGVDLDMRRQKIDKSFKDHLLEKYDVDLNRHKLIVSIGRAVKRKGFSWFANTVVPEIKAEVRYIIIGPTVSKNNMELRLLNLLPKTMSRQIKLLTGFPDDSLDIKKSADRTGGKVIQTGSIDYNELLKIMSCADLMVMPNVRVEGDMEGFGLVALEANVMSCPVLASDIEGITSAITSGSNGLLLEAENKDVWVNTINTLLNNQERLNLMAESARIHVNKNYNWEKMTDAYSSEFNSLTSEAIVSSEPLILSSVI